MAPIAPPTRWSRKVPRALISFGLAGGLAPGILPGALLVPTEVLEGPRSYPCDPALMQFLGGPTGRPIAAGHKIAATVHDKSTLYRRTRADAIDLESGAVARVASARHLPFAVLRAIADPAQRNLPAGRDDPAKTRRRHRFKTHPGLGRRPSGPNPRADQAGAGRSKSPRGA